MSTGAIDEARLEQFMGKMVGHMTGAACFRSGWATNSGSTASWPAPGRGPPTRSPPETGCNARLVREWLDGQAAGGLVAYDPAADSYELSARGGAGAGRRQARPCSWPGR